jgi:hypothetical protein
MFLVKKIGINLGSLVITWLLVLHLGQLCGNVEEGNYEGVDFYILMCTKPMYTLFASYKCPWGYQFNACDVVVARRYYQKWGHFEHLNVFLKGFHVVILDVCNV